MIFLEALILSFSIVEDGVSLLRLKIESEALSLKNMTELLTLIYHSVTKTIVIHIKMKK